MLHFLVVPTRAFAVDAKRHDTIRYRFLTPFTGSEINRQVKKHYDGPFRTEAISDELMPRHLTSCRAFIEGIPAEIVRRAERIQSPSLYRLSSTIYAFRVPLDRGQCLLETPRTFSP